jgi:UDP-N-acetylmuramate-alanine ligase
MLTCRKQKTVSVAGKPGRAHLVGACGSGMQSLAGVLLGRGWSLSGSDLTAADDRWLRAAGRAAKCLGVRTPLVLATPLG